MYFIDEFEFSYREEKDVSGLGCFVGVFFIYVGSMMIIVFFVSREESYKEQSIEKELDFFY